MKKALFAVLVLFYSWSLAGQLKPFEITIKPDKNRLMTSSIQSAIDSCAVSGGGVVRFMEGTYLSGGIQLKNKVILHLGKDVVLQGSNKYTDYKNDAFIFGKDISGITIEEEGTIDGVDCFNPEGEEGFRGPHCIRLINCRDIRLEGITIRNSANWAINCRNCSHGIVTNIVIRGGHDGLHTRFCDNFTVKGCDFRTGDDAFAGNDNRNFMISECKINTSCNGFRLGQVAYNMFHGQISNQGQIADTDGPAVGIKGAAVVCKIIVHAKIRPGQLDSDTACVGHIVKMNTVGINRLGA